ncbi:transcription initiation factor IIA gamma chain (nucleomorph) [Lotharella oceanica]|uniref:Transcription initiation factor IIA gamma chain n=1 Tax=Lotharella oceanica TaxID=641309 RepID=A0A060DGB2_9EUKA|nr:transcription initiation factor IIA gamma chain [Lotharella oceanica]
MFAILHTPMIKKKETFQSIFDRYTFYRSSKIGLALIKILLNLYRKNKIRTYFIFFILNKFDEVSIFFKKYIHLLLKKKITSTANFRGMREEYKNIEDIWYFFIENLSFFMDLKRRINSNWEIRASCSGCYVMLLEKK